MFKSIPSYSLSGLHNVCLTLVIVIFGCVMSNNGESPSSESEGVTANKYNVQQISVDKHLFQGSTKNTYLSRKENADLNDDLSAFHTSEPNDHSMIGQLPAPSRLDYPLQPKSRTPETILYDFVTTDQSDKIQHSHVLLRSIGDGIESPLTESSNDQLLKNSIDNCTDPREDKGVYNTSCEFVLEECGHKSELIDYLAFVLCDLPHVQPLAYVVMAIWFLYLIALLATTVDHHFVPPLTFLSEKMKLTPSIAGITLLALGNGAPDIFVVFSGISQDDAALVLGSLSGGGIFVTTVVLGTVILAANLTLYKIDKVDFMRDLIAYAIVVVTIIAVSIDGVVYLLEACMFPLLYFIYLAIVIVISYIRECYKKRSKQETNDLLDEIVYYDEDSAVNSLTHSVVLEPITTIKKGENEELLPVETKPDTNKVHLAGLTWPSKSNFIVKILWLLQLPFGLLRWITIPPFSHDGRWSICHYFLAAFSPIPISMLLLIAVKGWDGFTIYINVIPLPAILVLIGAVISLLLFGLLRPRKKPHWCMQILLVPASFVTAIVWLNIIANEIVSILRAFGLLLHIDTAILGLTVLAIGNSVADWVSNTVIARTDKPQMAFASCFGAPLLGHVVGLSTAIIVKIVFYQYGEPFLFDISDSSYIPVKLSWIFLGISLLISALVFPLSCFSPKRLYGVVLLLLYITFTLFAILEETNVLPVNI